MKAVVFLSVVLVGTVQLFSASPVVYEEDFSNDPGWTTDQSQNFYWSDGSKTFSSRTINGHPGYNPNRYAYTTVPLDTSKSFHLQWDQKMLSAGVGSISPFGLMSPDLLIKKATPQYQQHYIPESTLNLWMGAWTNSMPQDNSIGLGAVDTTGYSVGFGSYAGASTERRLDLNIWYRNSVWYDPSTASVGWSILNRDSGVIVADGVRQFPTKSGLSDRMTRLGISNNPHGYPSGQISAHNPDQYAEAELDNIRLLSFDGPPDPGPRPIYADLPTRRPEATGLVLLAHGWTSSPEEWANEAATSISSTLQGLGKGEEWDVVSYDWSERADTSYPDLALLNGKIIGSKLASEIGDKGYSHVHVISHSAATGLNDRIADKLQGSGVTVHSTFLDAYTPLGTLGLGDTATWAEHYVDTRFPPLTNGRFVHAHNVDVTALDPTQEFNGHSWPHEWYRQTIADPDASSHSGYGFQLSKEYSGSLPTYESYPAGEKVVLDGTSMVEVFGSSFGTRLDLLDGTYFKSSTGTVTDLGDGALRFETGSPVWITSLLEPEEAFNLLAFDYEFVSNAEGWLSVYLNGELVFNADERYALSGLNEEMFWLGQDFAPGAYTLAFRLDSYSDTTSTLNVSNVRLGSIPEPGAVVFLAFAAMGVIRRRR